MGAENTLTVGNATSFRIADPSQKGSSTFAWWMPKPLAAHGGSLYSTFLFPMPSAIYGLARLLDLGGQLDSYNVSLTPAQADALALGSDWLAVSCDFREVMASSVRDFLQRYLDSEEGQTGLEERLEKLTAAR